MTPDQLPHLETFAKAAELNGFTAAARALGMTQAGVSQRIQALEQAVDQALFHRQGGRVMLTEAGQLLYSFAQRILTLHREAHEAITGRKAPLVGELSLAVSSVPGEHLLPDMLSTFRQKHPHIQLRVSVLDSRAVLNQIEHGQAHLGLVGGKSDSPHLEYRCFACDRLVLITPLKHPWRRRRHISLEQFCTQPLILREPGSGSRWCLEHALLEAGKSLNDLQVALELGSNEAIKEAVQRSLGLAVLSTHVVEKEVKARQLHPIQISDLPLLREMFVVWDRRRVLPISARLFLDLLEPCRVTGSRA